MNVNTAIEQYCSNRRSANTLRLYRTALRHLTATLEAEGTDPGAMDVRALKASHVMACIRRLADSDVSTSTIHSYASAILGFVRFLAVEDLADWDAESIARLRERIVNVAGRQPQRRLPRCVSDVAVAKILHAAERAPEHTQRLRLLRARNLALLHMLRATGARVSEVVSAKIGDLHVEDVAAIVTGKGDKQRYVFFDERSWRALHEYLRMRRLYGKSAESEDPIFVRYDRAREDTPEAISPTSVRNLLARLCEEAGLETTVTPHQFRHRVAVKVLEHSNLAITQDVLGHANPNTTRVYTHLTHATLRQALAVSEV